MAAAPTPAPVAAAATPAAPAAAATAQPRTTPTSSGTASRTSPAAGSGSSPAKLVGAGWSAIERGSYADARATFAEALEKQPGNSDARFGLGYAYEKLGNQPAAVRYYCRVASSGSGDARIEAQGRLRALDVSCE